MELAEPGIDPDCSRVEEIRGDRDMTQALNDVNHTPAQPPLLILASRSVTSYLLIQHLAARFEVAHVIFEAPHLRQMLRYRLRKLGAWVVAGQLVFLVWDRLWLRRRSRGRIAALLHGHDTTPPDGRLPVTDVDSVNSPQARALIESIAPGVVVVSGTGIIGKKSLALAPTFINIHCGITPRYRGVHGGFWAVVEDRRDLAGVTIHQIDPGVDTGGIIAQATITIDPQTDTFRTLPVRQYLAGLDLMSGAVERALRGDLTTFQRDDLTSRQWYSPTPGDYWRFVRRLRRWRT